MQPNQYPRQTQGVDVSQECVFDMFVSTSHRQEEEQQRQEMELREGASASLLHALDCLSDDSFAWRRLHAQPLPFGTDPREACSRERRDGGGLEATRDSSCSNSSSCSGGDDDLSHLSAHDEQEHRCRPSKRRRRCQEVLPSWLPLPPNLLPVVVIPSVHCCTWLLQRCAVLQASCLSWYTMPPPPQHDPHLATSAVGGGWWPRANATLDPPPPAGAVARLGVSWGYAALAASRGRVHCLDPTHPVRLVLELVRLAASQAVDSVLQSVLQPASPCDGKATDAVAPLLQRTLGADCQEVAVEVDRVGELARRIVAGAKDGRPAVNAAARLAARLEEATLQDGALSLSQSCRRGGRGLGRRFKANKHREGAYVSPTTTAAAGPAFADRRMQRVLWRGAASLGAVCCLMRNGYLDAATLPYELHDKLDDDHDNDDDHDGGGDLGAAGVSTSLHGLRLRLFLSLQRLLTATYAALAPAAAGQQHQAMKERTLSPWSALGGWFGPHTGPQCPDVSGGTDGTAGSKLEEMLPHEAIVLVELLVEGAQRRNADVQEPVSQVLDTVDWVRLLAWLEQQALWTEGQLLASTRGMRRTDSWQGRERGRCGTVRAPATAYETAAVAVTTASGGGGGTGGPLLAPWKVSAEPQQQHVAVAVQRAQSSAAAWVAALSGAFHSDPTEAVRAVTEVGSLAEAVLNTAEDSCTTRRAAHRLAQMLGCCSRAVVPGTEQEPPLAPGRRGIALPAALGILIMLLKSGELDVEDMGRRAAGSWGRRRIASLELEAMWGSFLALLHQLQVIVRCVVCRLEVEEVAGEKMEEEDSAGDTAPQVAVPVSAIPPPPPLPPSPLPSPPPLPPAAVEAKVEAKAEVKAEATTCTMCATAGDLDLHDAPLYITSEEIPCVFGEKLLDAGLPGCEAGPRPLGGEDGVSGPGPVTICWDSTTATTVTTATTATAKAPACVATNVTTALLVKSEQPVPPQPLHQQQVSRPNNQEQQPQTEQQRNEEEQQHREQTLEPSQPVPSNERVQAMVPGVGGKRRAGMLWERRGGDLEKSSESHLRNVVSRRTWVELLGMDVAAEARTLEGRPLTEARSSAQASTKSKSLEEQSAELAMPDPVQDGRQPQSIRKRQAQTAKTWVHRLPLDLAPETLTTQLNPLALPARDVPTKQFVEGAVVAVDAIQDTSRGYAQKGRERQEGNKKRKPTDIQPHAPAIQQQQQRALLDSVPAAPRASPCTSRHCKQSIRLRSEATAQSSTVPELAPDAPTAPGAAAVAAAESQVIESGEGGKTAPKVSGKCSALKGSPGWLTHPQQLKPHHPQHPQQSQPQSLHPHSQVMQMRCKRLQPVPPSVFHGTSQYDVVAADVGGVRQHSSGWGGDSGGGNGGKNGEVGNLSNNIDSRGDCDVDMIPETDLEDEEKEEAELPCGNPLEDTSGLQQHLPRQPGSQLHPRDQSVFGGAEAGEINVTVGGAVTEVSSAGAGTAGPAATLSAAPIPAHLAAVDGWYPGAGRRGVNRVGIGTDSILPSGGFLHSPADGVPEPPHRGVMSGVAVPAVEAVASAPFAMSLSSIPDGGVAETPPPSLLSLGGDSSPETEALKAAAHALATRQLKLAISRRRKQAEVTSANRQLRDFGDGKEIGGEVRPLPVATDVHIVSRRVTFAEKPVCIPTEAWNESHEGDVENVSDVGGCGSSEMAM